MLRRTATIGVGAIFLLMLVLGYESLKTWCSFDGSLPKFEAQLKPNGSNEKTNNPNASQQPTAQEWDQVKPTASFDLHVTDSHKIEGRYYAEKADKEDWGHKFFCDIKIGEVLLAIFTLFLVFYTARLYWATNKLADADRPHIFPGHFSIGGMRTGGPVEVGFNFENCGRSPAYLRNIIIGARQETNLPEHPPFKEANTVEMLFGLAPGKVFFPAGKAKADIGISADVISKVLSGETTLFVYGCVNFEETSGIKHFQRFAYRYAPASDELVNCGPGAYWDHS
jgi:hypothetical protein